MEESPAWVWESEETSCDLLSMSLSEQLTAPELDTEAVAVQELPLA